MESKNFIRLHFFIGLLALTNFSCQTQRAQVTVNSNVNKASETADLNKNTDELVESFSDDKSVGVAGKNKVEIFNYKKSNGNLAVVKFYALGENKEWKLKQNLEFEKDDTLRCDPEIKDFNNDGFKDVTYVSEAAGRGANEIRKLFIYDKIKDELVYIKNSEEYPNLMYNRGLNCLDAQRFYGGTATDFLRLENDTLKKFAYIETVGTERKVYSVDKNGKEKLLRTDKVKEENAFERYKTFNPPKIYTDEDLKQ